MSFEYPLRVYYEDTDAGGIVYHANYLKFMERGRTEALLSLGLSQTELRQRHGLIFVVRDMEIAFRASARFEDQLVVTVRAGPAAGARLEMAQEVRREGAPLVTCRLTLASIGPEGRPARMPGDLRAALARLPAL